MIFLLFSNGKLCLFSVKTYVTQYKYTYITHFFSVFCAEDHCSDNTEKQIILSSDAFSINKKCDDWGILGYKKLVELYINRNTLDQFAVVYISDGFREEVFRDTLRRLARPKDENHADFSQYADEFAKYFTDQPSDWTKKRILMKETNKYGMFLQMCETYNNNFSVRIGNYNE